MLLRLLILTVFIRRVYILLASLACLNVHATLLPHHGGHAAQCPLKLLIGGAGATGRFSSAPLPDLCGNAVLRHTLQAISIPIAGKECCAVPHIAGKRGHNPASTIAPAR